VPNKYIGISVDGSRATLVMTIDDIATSTESVDLLDVATSIRSLLRGVKQKKNDPPIRVSITAASTTVRKVDVTHKTLKSYEDFNNALFSAIPLPRDVTSMAGVVYDRENLVGDVTCVGTAASVPTSIVSQVYEALESRRSEVVATPLVLSMYDGVWLGVHQNIASVSLVSGGQLAAYRQLRIGGLASVASTLLGASVEVALMQERVHSALTTIDSSDTQALAELGRYTRMLTSELQQTVEYWRRTGETIPNDGAVLAYGPGAESVLLDDALSDSGLTRALCIPLDRSLVHIPASKRLDSYAAFLTAVSATTHMPYISYANPNAVANKATRRKKLKVLSVSAFSVIIASILGLVVVKPLLDAKSAESDAKVALRTAEEKFREIEDIYKQAEESSIRYSIIKEVTVNVPDWRYVYSEMYKSLPASSLVSQISSTSDQGIVTLNISLSILNGSYADITSWLTRLEQISGVSDAWSRGFTTREGKVTADVSVTVLPISEESK
jgi:hypothetical protein